MSNNAAPTKKGSRRRFLLPFRSRNRSTSPSSQSPPATAVTITATQATPPSPTTSHVSVAVPPNGTTPSVQSVSFAPFHVLWRIAFRLLSEQDQTTLRNHMPNAAAQGDVALDQAITAAQKHRKEYEGKKWTFTLGGRTITLVEEVDKIIHWLNRFKSVGDIAANVDPLHVGLPWAGVRLLLEVAVANANQQAAILVGCESALYMSNRLKVYAELHSQLPATQARANFEDALVQLYVCILSFLAQAVQACQRSTIQRLVHALWTDGEIADFQARCDKLATSTEIEARNCDRILFEQYQQRTILELERLHGLQVSLARVEIKFDLDKLPYAAGAEFDAYGSEPEMCHPKTRVDVLRQIQQWIEQSNGRHIFWLNGMAGTGKSTISRTVAKWSCDPAQTARGVDLGASFFFKRGEGDRGTAMRFFPTLVRQLVIKVPALAPLVAAVIDREPNIHNKFLGEQFDKLLYQPLQALSINGPNPSTVVVVVDALDECDKHDDVRVILQLCSRLSKITTLQLRLFLTSRPELPIRLGFKKMSGDVHQDMVLHDVPQTVIYDDIFTFIRDSFVTIQEDHDDGCITDTSLGRDWPGNDVIQALTNIAVPLFIVAATICRFVGDPSEVPKRQLQQLLELQALGGLSQMEKTYLPVLQRLPMTHSEPGRRDYLYEQFRKVVGAVITFAEPLSIISLAALIEIPIEVVGSNLNSLHSVLKIPTNIHNPVRILHLSFAEFMVAESRHEFSIDSVTTHRMLLSQCLRTLSGSRGLRENICELPRPGQLRTDISPSIIQQCLASEIQYACQYWVYHTLRSSCPIIDGGEVHLFLQHHFLHWLEALSLMGRLSIAISALGDLQSAVSDQDSSELSALLEDARRFTLANRFIADLAPVQLYSSAIVFSPQSSLVRNICGLTPSWLRGLSGVPQNWSLQLQTLEGHTDAATAVTFSPNGKLLASASWDKTVRVWDSSTGQELQQLIGHSDWVKAVAFSPDGKLLASASHDHTVRVWNSSTGEEVMRLTEPNTPVETVVFSPNGKLLASVWDGMARVLDSRTGQELQRLEERSSWINVVTFTPDGKLLASASWHGTLCLRDSSTGEMVQQLDGHVEPVTAMAFSPDGELLASASDDHTVRVWDSSTGEMVQQLTGHMKAVTAVAFSSDGELLASASNDDTVRVWDSSTGEELQQLTGHTNGVEAVTFSPNGKLMASASLDNTVRIWDSSIVKASPLSERYAGAVTGVALSPNDTLMASASVHDGIVRIWDSSTGQKVRQLEGHTDGVWTVTFTSDGKMLASGSNDQTIRLWNSNAGQEVHQCTGHTGRVLSVAFSPNGKLLASGSWDETVRLWNSSTGQEERQLKGHNKSVWAVAFTSDGKMLASGSADQTIRLWNSGTARETQCLIGHTELVHLVAFSPDNKILVSASHDDTVRVWVGSSGREVQQFKLKDVSSLSFRHDNCTVYTDRGALLLDPSLVSVPDLTANPYRPPAREATGLVLNNEWVQYNGHNFLWLPPDYRTSASAVRGDAIAFGLASGWVSLMRLDLQKVHALFESG